MDILTNVSQYWQLKKSLRNIKIQIVNNFYTFHLYMCQDYANFVPYKMRRFPFFIEQEWIDRLKRDMKTVGLPSVASYIRYIIINHFKDKD